MYNFFSSDYYDERPDEAVTSAANVLSCLEILIAEAGQIQMSDRDISGLTTILASVINVLDDAAESTYTFIKFRQERDRNEAAPIVEEAVTRAKEILQKDQENSSEAIAERVREKMAKDKGEIYPKLSAKEQAVAATFKSGFPVTEIAKAVNLKAASVENMIKQLRDKGCLPPTEFESEQDHAANG